MRQDSVYLLRNSIGLLRKRERTLAVYEFSNLLGKLNLVSKLVLLAGLYGGCGIPLEETASLAGMQDSSAPKLASY